MSFTLVSLLALAAALIVVAADLYKDIRNIRDDVVDLYKENALLRRKLIKLEESSLQNPAKKAEATQLTINEFLFDNEFKGDQP
jgi:cell division protein FtsB